MKPLVKWAGGKRQLLGQIISRMPDEWDHYYEPFAGGLALLVELHNLNRIKGATVSDVNPELVNLYSTVRDCPHDLVETVKGLEFGNDEKFYYRIREEFNSMIGRDQHRLERAAFFLYLNRHGYNGLWRVNSAGRFNVPFGKYSRPSIPGSSHILEFSEMLQDVRIECTDFRASIKEIGERDFVYFDPPYVPVSRTSNFTDYSKEGFSRFDQERLLDTCRELESRGIRFILSNSYSENNIGFYSDFKLVELSARRNINCKSDGRSGQKELLVMNF